MNILAYVHLRNILGSTGSGRVARQMTEHLARLPGDRMVVLGDATDFHRVVPEVGQPWTTFDYRWFTLETSKQQARWIFLHTPAAECFWPDAEIVYCTAESYVPTRRAKLVVTLHDAAFFEPDAHRKNWAFWKQRWKWRFLFRVLAREATLFHTVSNFSAERLGYFFPELKSRLRVVHNGVAARFFAPVSAEGERHLAHLGLKDRPYILLPRGLHYRKNADLVFKVWPRLRECQPDVLLVVTSHCEPAYLERASSMGPSVRLTGFVSDEALCSFYHNASAVWFPSRYEGFGLPVLEAMACGTPVVASDASSIPEIAGDAAILAPSSSIDAHVDALDSLLSDARLNRSLAARGRLWAQQFTWERSAAALRTEFSSIL